MYGRTLLRDLMWKKNKMWQRLRHVVPWKAQRPKLLQVFSPRWRTEWTLRQLISSQQGQSLLDDGPQRSTSVFCSLSFSLFFVIHILICRYALACEPNISATLWVLHTKCYSWVLHTKCYSLGLAHEVLIMMLWLAKAGQLVATCSPVFCLKDLRRGHSTETALLRILNDLLVMTDGGNNAVLVLLDLSAAFDTLDHTLLL